MTLVFTFAALVNAGGGLVFLLLGIGILAIARRRALRLGLFSVTFGAAYIVNNIVALDSPAAVLLEAAVFAVLVVATALLIMEIARPLGARDRRALIAFAAASFFVVVPIAVGSALDPDLYTRVAAAQGLLAPVRGANLDLVTLCLSAEAMCVLAAAAALRARRAIQPRERRAFLLLGVGLAVFNAVLTTFILLYGYSGFGAHPLLAVGFLLQTLLIAATATFFLPREGEQELRLQRAAFSTIVAAGLVGAGFDVAAIAGASADVGQFGVARTIAATLLAIAILKYDLLGIPLPAIALRRGPLAATALAMLFIVAQIAQNFFSAQFGLLTGGVVAGAFLFAASPIQRAMERMGERRASDGQAPVAGRSSEKNDSTTTRREEVYRKAVRVAMADHVVTRDEDVHLYELAEELGIGAGRAAQLRRDVEQEAR